MKRVLDAPPFLTGRPFAGELSTVPEVLAEVHRHGVRLPLEAILETQVTVRQPSREAMDAVRVASGATGDAPRLSPTDAALLALAKDLGAVLVTDDYSIDRKSTRLNPSHG